MSSGTRFVVSRDIADTDYLGLGFAFAVGSGFSLAGLVSAVGVGGEFTHQSGAAEDDDVVAVADAVTDVTDPAAAHIDHVGRNAEAVRGSTDRVAGHEDRLWQRLVCGPGLFGGLEDFGGGGPCRARWPLVVVEFPELLELVVEVGEGGRRIFGAQPLLQGLPEPFDLAAGLGYPANLGRSWSVAAGVWAIWFGWSGVWFPRNRGGFPMPLPARPWLP
jgi:hypothetical protein